MTAAAVRDPASTREPRSKLAGPLLDVANQVRSHEPTHRAHRVDQRNAAGRGLLPEERGRQGPERPQPAEHGLAATITGTASTFERPPRSCR